MTKKFQLDINRILEQQFSVDFKGYSPVEVDQFLDDVIQDYQNFQELLTEYENKVKELEYSNAGLKRSLLELEGKQRVQSDLANTTYNQVDVLKRLARLEAILLEKE